ncbi:MAG TPA: tetratricopeptide repeat protein [Longimicrobium sp.]|nr:tetratricopeptide repeat protein [Longimicrobium sp.]
MNADRFRWTPRHARTAAVAAPALLAILVFINALANGYAVDDNPILLENPVVHGLGELRQVLLGPWWPGTHSLYRPVTLFSLALQWALHGDAPVAFHAGNLLLHGVATALVAVLLLRLGAVAWGAGVGAAIFAVHPVHVEAVANVVGRAEILAAVFYLAACVVYLGAPRLTAGRTAAIAALMLLALGSKEMAVTLPAALLVLDALRSRGERTPIATLLRRNLGIVAVLLATLAAYLLLRRAVLGDVLGESGAAFLAPLGTGRRLALAARLWPEYLRLLLWPADLSAEWGPATLNVPTWSDPGVWRSLALIAALAAVAAWAWKRARWAGAALLWLAVTVFPVSQLAFPVGVMLAERTLYLPSVAVAFLAPPIVAAAMREAGDLRRITLGAAAVLLALAAARTWMRTPVWRSSSAVFDSLVEEHAEVWRVDWRAAEMLTEAGRGDDALPYFHAALEKTEFAHPRLLERYTRWMLLAGEPRRAEDALRRGLSAYPRAPVLHLYLGRARFDQGAWRGALGEARAVHADPGGDGGFAADASHLQALAYDALGARDSAAAMNDAALRDPAWRRGAAGWLHRARLRALAGDTAGARAAVDEARARVAPAYRAALRVDPVPPVTHPALRGWVAWRPDGRPAGLRGIGPRVRAEGEAVAAGAAAP